jgi:alpha-tubulin suppressor-like RCC1 family protein
VPIGGAVKQIAVGVQHTCAVLETGKVRCWGTGGFGMLGYGKEENLGDDETPASAGDVDVGDSVAQIAAGMSHTCALLVTGKVRCWGLGLVLGHVEFESIGDDEAPASAGDVDVGGKVVQLAAGDYHTCALIEGGTVRCWGTFTAGALGYGNQSSYVNDHVPALNGDVDIGGKVTQIAASGSHTCALLAGGTVRCWGDAGYGQLGYGVYETIGDDETPADAGDVELGENVVGLALGRGHSCVLIEGGNVRCWGRSDYGMLGYGNDDTVWDPTSVGHVDVGAPVSFLSTGQEHTCAILAGGSVRCWGLGLDGQLGYANAQTIGDNELPSSAGVVSLY